MTTHHTSGAADLPEALTADQWLDLAIRHANKDWNSAQPDGYANAVKALCADFAALTAQAISPPGGFDASDMASAAAQGYRDGWAAAQAISAEPAAHVQNPAEVEHVAGDVSKNGAELNMSTQPVAQQEVQEPCTTCAALARTVMLDQVSFDRKPDCYGIRQITDDEGVEEWEDIRTSPDVAREEANDMMATGRGEIYEVVPLWTTPQPSPTAKMQERHDQRIENIVSGLERIKQEQHAGQQPQKIDECYGDCPTDSTTCTNPCRFDGRAARAPADSVLEDAARWEFRWLNPANNLHVAPSDLGWKTVNSKGMRSEKEVLEDLQAYRYQGKPVYEVRPLFATRALEKPEIRCPVRLANGGDCPRHNLQCGWPDCNKESK